MAISYLASLLLCFVFSNTSFCHLNIDTFQPVAAHCNLRMMQAKPYKVLSLILKISLEMNPTSVLLSLKHVYFDVYKNMA